MRRIGALMNLGADDPLLRSRLRASSVALRNGAGR